MSLILHHIVKEGEQYALLLNMTGHQLRRGPVCHNLEVTATVHKVCASSKSPNDLNSIMFL